MATRASPKKHQRRDMPSSLHSYRHIQFSFGRRRKMTARFQVGNRKTCANIYPGISNTWADAEQAMVGLQRWKNYAFSCLFIFTVRQVHHLTIMAPCNCLRIHVVRKRRMKVHLRAKCSHVYYGGIKRWEMQVSSFIYRFTGLHNIYAFFLLIK